jgi:hypothetical protein
MAHRRPMIRCQCEICVADRWADRFWRGFFILAGAYIGFQIVRAVIWPS